MLKNEYIRYDDLVYIFNNISFEEILESGNTILKYRCDDEKGAGGLYDLAGEYIKDNESKRISVYYSLTWLFRIIKELKEKELLFYYETSGFSGKYNLEYVISEVMSTNAYDGLDLKVRNYDCTIYAIFSLNISEKETFRITSTFDDMSLFLELSALFNIIIFGGDVE